MYKLLFKRGYHHVHFYILPERITRESRQGLSTNSLRPLIKEALDLKWAAVRLESSETCLQRAHWRDGALIWELILTLKGGLVLFFVWRSPIRIEPQPAVKPGWKYGQHLGSPAMGGTTGADKACPEESTLHYYQACFEAIWDLALFDLEGAFWASCHSLSFDCGPGARRNRGSDVHLSSRSFVSLLRRTTDSAYIHNSPLCLLAPGPCLLLVRSLLKKTRILLSLI